MPANCCYCTNKIDEYSGASPVCSSCRRRRREDILVRVDRGETFADIGRAWSVSRERIRQIAKAMDIQSPVQIARQLQTTMAAHAHGRYERMLAQVAQAFDVDTIAVEEAIKRHNAHTCLDCPMELTNPRRKRCAPCARLHTLAVRRRRYKNDPEYKAKVLASNKEYRENNKDNPKYKAMVSEHQRRFREKRSA